MTDDVWGQGEYWRVAERILPAAEALVTAAGVGEGQRVLDVGAGTGNLAVLAAERHALVTACDLSPGMVELGEQQTIGHDIEWLEADAQDLPFGDGDFDAALSVFAAIFAPDAEAVASELLRVVKPGGVAGLTAWVNEGPLADVMAYVNSLGDRPAVHLGWDTEAVARERLAAAAAVTVERRTLRWEFADGQEWLAYYERGPGPMSVLRSHYADEAWAPVRARMLELVGAGDEPFVLEPPYLVVTARR